MAVEVLENKTFTQTQSDITPIANEIDMDKIDAVKAHCFAGVQFFDDAAGTNPVAPTVGTVTIEIQTLNTRPVFEAPPNDTIQANAPTTLDWAANTVRVKAIPAGIDVATHYRLVVTANET